MHKAYNIVHPPPLLFYYCTVTPYLIPFDVFHRRLKSVTAFTKNGLVQAEEWGTTG